MNLLNFKRIMIIILNILLGGMLIYGGIKKFFKPIPAPTAMIEQIKNGEEVASTLEVLKIKNYIFGMKQTKKLPKIIGLLHTKNIIFYF